MIIMIIYGSVRLMKKIIFVFIIAIYLLGFCVSACAVDVSAKSAIVMDAASKRILYEKDVHTRRGMASTTKIMTGLIAIESLNPSDTVSVSPFAASTEGSSIWLSPGENISVKDLLYGLLLSSGNDAATALAEHAAGSVESFTLIMNEKARRMGAMNTNFTNPHGLPDDNHYTTAYDLALISANAMENEFFREIVKTKNKTISWENSEWDRSLSNHNKLLKTYAYCVGIKTGYTKKDGRCLVSCSEKDGRRLIVVTLAAPDDWNDHVNLSEYCFSQYKSYKLCEENEKTGVLVPKAEDADRIELMYKEDYITSLTEEEFGHITKEFSFNPVFPVKVGDKVGECNIYFDDDIIGKVDLIAVNSSEIKRDFLTVVKRLMKGIVRA